MHANVMDFMIWGRLTRPRGPFRAQGSALTRNVARSHGSKNLLQRVIIYRHKRYYCVKEDCRPRPSESICSFWMGICPYLWIDQFVWSRVFCGPREHQSASLDCSGFIQKIHMRKIGRHEGVAHDNKMSYFMIRGR